MPLRHHFQLHETIATIIADRQEDIDYASKGMADARHEIERYILFDPFFKLSFDPVAVHSNSQVITNMAKAAYSVGVGPMAAVAGAVADAGIKAVSDRGGEFCIIDNGGDIALINSREVRIGLYAGDSKLSGKYAFLIRPMDKPYGVCTSSATVGHSISLGTADSVTVFGHDPVLADAAATWICNTLTPDDHSSLDSIPENIDGLFAVFGEKSLIWGEIPPITKARVNEGLITSGKVIV